MGRRGWTSSDALMGWVQIIRGPRPPSVKWPPVGQQVRQSAQLSHPQSHRPVNNQVKTSGIRPIRGSKRQDGSGKGARDEVGVSVNRHGRNGRSGGRFGASSPQTCTRGSPGCPSRHPKSRRCERATICQNIETSKKWLAELKAQCTSRPPKARRKYRS